MAGRANLEPSLRDLVVLQATVQPSCISHSENTLANFEMNPGVIPLLPKFCGNHEDDPHMHIKEFFEICSFMRIGVMNDEEVRMSLFPFSLKDSAKAWLYSLPPNSITTWATLTSRFLQFFPAQRTRKIGIEIVEIQQLDGEPFHEYWERYKKLLNSCPNHNIPEWLLMQCFYEGLLYSDRMMVDATSEGSFMDKTPKQARETFENVSNNSLHKYCVDSKRKIKKEILEIQQLDGEPFHEYWERYKKLLNSYPDHNIPEWHLMHTFYEGLLYSDRMMVNATSGGSLMDKTPKQARETFENFSSNSLPFNYRRPPPKKSGVYEVSTSSHLEAQITNLTNLVKQMMQVSSNVCAICTTPSHVNEACPQGAERQSFNDFMMEQAYVVGPYQNNQRTISDYNPAWHNRPNFRWSDNQNVQQGPAQP